MGPEEFEEVRELLSADRIYRVVLMQVIGFLHILFDFLAFKNDVGFWKGREDLKGLSSRGIIASAMQTLIIYLYLLDSDSINSIILMTYTVSTALELWKVAKVLALRARHGDDTAVRYTVPLEILRQRARIESAKGTSKSRQPRCVAG